jgi:hypothetical protein
MRTYSSAILFLIATTVWAPNASSADEVPAEVNGRFKQATNRTFQTFDQQREQTWQKPFFFFQLADTQYGMFTKVSKRKQLWHSKL